MKTTYKRIKQSLFISLALCALVPAAVAQVKGISYSISPVGEYVNWENNTGISNGFMAGGHLGFGFGEFVELRGTYLQSLDMKRNFGPLELKELQGVELTQPDIDVTRWGGDLKLNLSRGGVVPFLTAGTGVQTFKSDSLATYKNIYVSLGAGLQFVVADRYTLGIQAVNTSFNDSPVRNLTTADERAAYGLAVADYNNELLKNWSVRASLSFYLGGRRPGELTETDKAYLNNFSGGFSLPIEITAGQLDFDKTLPYANTKFVGAATGFNFGPYVGLRGFYWRAMEDDYFSTFDKLAVYGGEGKFKLANGQGLTPSINVGGGVIDALKGYTVDGTELDEKNRPFVSGGLGLDIPFGRAFKLTAYGKALLTSNDPLENAANPDELATSWAYGLSANLILGNGVKNIQTQKEESYDEVVKNSMTREKNRARDLKEEYEDRIDQLNDGIREARDDGNRRLANDLEDDREALRVAVDRIEETLKQEEKANEEANRKDDPLLMKMKPTDFAKKIDGIKEEVPGIRRVYAGNDSDRDRGTTDRRRDSESGVDARTLRALEDRLQSIEDKLDDIQKQNNDFRRNQPTYRNDGSRTDASFNDRSNTGNTRGDRNGAYDPQANDQPMEMLKAERQKSEELRAAYEKRIEKLEAEVKNARQSGNVQIEEDLNAELKSMQEGILKIQDAQQRENEANRDAYQLNDPARIRMNPEAFRSEINAVERTNDRYREQIERSLRNYQRQNQRQINTLRDDRDAYRREMENEMDQLRQELRELKYNRAGSGTNAGAQSPTDLSRIEALDNPGGSAMSTGGPSPRPISGSARRSSWRTKARIPLKPVFSTVSTMMAPRP
ncbi:hypothetical protein [Salmonirosea aquatica]|uniref:Outer membrane beta-barrel protein n=1 Tax=Salmonirosea aquatica TaxID=2654236 RepID=A0A7C9BHW1_9BACT|nr:hypothetical protein [Cytophagaceae bacterium SJW1-29]